jgi:hypothetical protein
VASISHKVKKNSGRRVSREMIEVGKNDIYTFMDCPDRGLELDNQPWYNWHECSNVWRFYPGCEINRQIGKCPRCFP